MTNLYILKIFWMKLYKIKLLFYINRIFIKINNEISFIYFYLTYANFASSEKVTAIL